MSIPIELMVEPHADHSMSYQVVWPDADVFLQRIPEIWLDVLPFLIARGLLEQGYNVDRTLIVRLQGADYELMRAPLGQVAATPLLNPVPVHKPTHNIMPARARS